VIDAAAAAAAIAACAGSDERAKHTARLAVRASAPGGTVIAPRSSVLSAAPAPLHRQAPLHFAAPPTARTHRGRGLGGGCGRAGEPLTRGR